MLSVTSHARPALAGLALALSGAVLTAVPAAAPASAGPAAPAPAVAAASSDKAGREPRVGFRAASLNLPHTMSAGGVKHDIRQVIRQGKPSIIGFQERGGSKHAMRAALPRHWALLMPTNASGTDLTPIAVDRRVWKVQSSWATLLAGRTWRRARGNIAIDQYGVVARLKNRESGHLVRVISFHMPPDIHNKNSGGPNWHNRDRVEAFQRMAANVVEQGRKTKDAQFIALCDCNVKASRDTTDQLVQGRIVKPLRLATNYDRGPAPVPFEADYVMAERKKGFKLVSWRQLNAGLITDHPSPVARFRENLSHYRKRTS